MNRVALGFVLAMAYNSSILIFSKGLSGNLGAIDPLFSPNGCIGVLLWGLAYLALARSYADAPAVALVFAVEKLFYGCHWLLWLKDHGGQLAEIRAADPLAGFFYSTYGSGDLVFMVFFGWVAWQHRHPKQANTSS